MEPIAEAKDPDEHDEFELGSAYLALRRAADRAAPSIGCATERAWTGHLHGVRRHCEQRLDEHVRVPWPGAGSQLHRHTWRLDTTVRRAATIYGGTAEIQRHLIARRPREE